ncbi:MAG TPA: hypothetical protein VEA17_06370 [Bordetella sp.]|nr:hypothetical protein [Bordetella sp.]
MCDYNIQPGSDAANVVSNVGDYMAAHPGGNPDARFDYVKSQLLGYSGDPVTAASTARAIEVMAERDPANAQAIAQDLTAKTVSSPSTISDRIRNKVAGRLEGQSGLSRAQQEAIAYQEAKSVLDETGVMETQSAADLRTNIKEYMDQGVSPAAAGAAAGQSAATSASSSPSTFSILGYLVRLVRGAVTYDFKDTQTLNVTGSVIHSHSDTVTYDLPGKNIHINCSSTMKTYSDQSLLNFRFHSGKGIGIYNGSYDATLYTSFSLYGGSLKYGGEWHVYSGYLLTGTLGRLYMAGFDNDIVLYNKSIEDSKNHRGFLLQTSLMGKGKVQSSTTQVP